MKSHLFSPIQLRDLKIRNRIFLSPMCMYSAENGVPNNWHLVHLGTRATGGVGLVMAEATAVTPEGRISPGDLGLWNNEQMEAYKPICEFVKSQGAVAAIQLAHAGRKAGTDIPWKGGRPLSIGGGGWTPVAPSAIAFAEGYQKPHELAAHEINQVIANFLSAAERALNAGFQVIEIHMAHGYLLHEFMSPISNHRQDQYGGSLENRMRLPLEIAISLRKFWPQNLPVFARISATDWVEGGWDLEQSVVLSSELKKIGLDLIDCSSGGVTATAKIPVGPGFQVPFASAIRQKTGIATGAVGMITTPQQAEEILAAGHADGIFLGRELLRNPYWALQAAEVLQENLAWPNQYLRGKL